MNVEIDYLMREIIKKKFSKLEEIPRDPRRDRDFCKIVFRDRDETENCVECVFEKRDETENSQK